MNPFVAQFLFCTCALVLWPFISAGLHFGVCERIAAETGISPAQAKG
jgi:hypothetical protein